METKSTADKVIAAVYQTSDYSKFKKLEDNRAVTTERKNKLISSFSAHEILNPIVVNKHFEIIDGQGRYEAKKELGLPIFYVMDPDATIDDCRRMNMYNSKWTSMDFCKSWAESGNENYVRILSVYRDTGATLNRILRLANKTNADRAIVENSPLVKGEIVFTEVDMEIVLNAINKAKEIRDALCVESRTNDTFFIAVKVMIETKGYLHSSMINNCKKNRSSYQQMAGLEDMLKEFSRIYNYGKKKDKLFFEDYMRNKGYNVRTYDQPYGKREEIDISTLQKKEGGKR